MQTATVIMIQTVAGAEPEVSPYGFGRNYRRKLVAVVYADMVGYSRLIGLDDHGTLERLRALRTT